MDLSTENPAFEPRSDEEAEAMVVIAGVCHEINRAYCAALGDDSQMPWTEAPNWQQMACLDGVAYVLGNLDATPADQHANWMAMKEREGWVYGREKDAGRKTHPCMVPYHHLPKDQKAKDYLFRAVVETLAPMLIGEVKG